jgi:NADPH:quinone reductase-like Zn-dependent oxidoreductase
VDNWPQQIYVTVGNEEKAKFIMETHGIPRDHIFNSRDESFKDDVLKATNGRGVDVVMNSLSGELLHASWKCVAEYGMMVEIGKTDLIGEGRLAMEVFEKNRGYHGVDIFGLGLEYPAQTAKCDDLPAIA